MPETTTTADQNLTCRDCKSSFVFTVGEQKFFAEKSFSPPTRCKACRQARKDQRPSEGASNFGPQGGSQGRSEADLFTGTPPDGGKRRGGRGGKSRNYNDD